MKREILFRGKRRDNGQWIEGGYVEWSDYKDRRYYQIVSSNGYHNEVDPSTIGQYTSYKDRNGQKIFEGDILSDVRADGHNALVTFNRGCFVLNTIGKSLTEISNFSHSIYSIERAVVIGNKYDNPELIEKK